MKPSRAIILFSATLLIGLARPVFAQGVVDGSFHGVSEMWASQRDLVQPVEADLDSMRLLREQSLIAGNLSTIENGVDLIEIDRSRLKDATISKALLPAAPKMTLEIPVTIPEPTALSLVVIGASSLVLLRRYRK